MPCCRWQVLISCLFRLRYLEGKTHRSQLTSPLGTPCAFIYIGKRYRKAVISTAIHPCHFWQSGSTFR